MSKRLLPLLLLSVWAPAALAFPPCPQYPMEVGPIDGGNGLTADAGTDKPVWFRGFYTLLGDPDVVGGLSDDGPFTVAPDAMKSGKCHDRMPVPESNSSDGSISLTPGYAPKSGFGVVALPDLRYANNPPNVRYTLTFTVDSAELTDDDWADIAQIEFEFVDDTGRKYPGNLGTVYRVRKIQHPKSGLNLEVIESGNASTDIGTEMGMSDMVAKPQDRVVARIPVSPFQHGTEISLRWSQIVDSGDKAELDTIASGGESTDSVIIIGPPIVQTHHIDSVFEVISGDGNVLYTSALPSQWASTLSMGLLDYNVDSDADYKLRYIAEAMGTSFTAEPY
jgi:hypothetical protein